MLVVGSINNVFGLVLVLVRFWFFDFCLGFHNTHIIQVQRERIWNLF